MSVPTIKVTLRGLTLPQELKSLGIVGFILKNGVRVATADNQLTAEQVKAIAVFVKNYPHPYHREEIWEWANNCFNTDDETIEQLKEIAEYMHSQIDLKQIIDPFNLIRHQDEQADPIR